MSEFTYPPLPDETRELMMNAAAQALQAQHALNEQHGGLLHYVLGQEDSFKQFQHYPATGDRIDYDTGAQYYYHCHREDRTSDEHGHFHTFIRAKRIPDSFILHPQANEVEYDVSPMTHLIAIAMNRLGQPIRLFTTNRHVAKEQWYDAEVLNQLNEQFHLQVEKHPEWALVDQWVEGVFTLFKPQIAWLQQQRDAQITELQSESAHDNIYEVKEIEELSSLPISIEAQAQWLMNDEAHHSSNEEVA